jgi:hypothetical protein
MKIDSEVKLVRKKRPRVQFDKNSLKPAYQKKPTNFLDDAARHYREAVMHQQED